MDTHDPEATYKYAGQYGFSFDEKVPHCFQIINSRTEEPLIELDADQAHRLYVFLYLHHSEIIKLLGLLPQMGD